MRVVLSRSNRIVMARTVKEMGARVRFSVPRRTGRYVLAARLGSTPLMRPTTITVR